jgi:hypothetical protein
MPLLVTQSPTSPLSYFDKHIYDWVILAKIFNSGIDQVTKPLFLFHVIDNKPSCTYSAQPVLHSNMQSNAQVVELVVDGQDA